MSFFHPWFARPCKLEIPWWLSCRWLLASSSLLALVPLSLQRPVRDVLSRLSSLNSFIPYQIRFQHPFNAASYLLSLPFTHCLVRVSSLSCPNLFRWWFLTQSVTRRVSLWHVHSIPSNYYRHIELQGFKKVFCTTFDYFLKYSIESKTLYFSIIFSFRI